MTSESKKYTFEEHGLDMTDEELLRELYGDGKFNFTVKAQNTDHTNRKKLVNTPQKLTEGLMDLFESSHTPQTIYTFCEFGGKSSFNWFLEDMGDLKGKQKTSYPGLAIVWDPTAYDFQKSSKISKHVYGVTLESIADPLNDLPSKTIRIYSVHMPHKKNPAQWKSQMKKCMLEIELQQEKEVDCTFFCGDFNRSTDHIKEALYDSNDIQYTFPNRITTDCNGKRDNCITTVDDCVVEYYNSQARFDLFTHHNTNFEFSMGC